MKLPCSFRHSVICNCANYDIHDDFGCNASVLFAIAHEKMRWKVLHWPISQSAVQRSRNKQATARMTSLLIVVLTTRVACITRFDQWDIFNDVTFQNIPRISPDVVAEILCVAGSLGRRMLTCMSLSWLPWQSASLITTPNSRMSVNHYWDGISVFSNCSMSFGI